MKWLILHGDWIVLALLSPGIIFISTVAALHACLLSYIYVTEQDVEIPVWADSDTIGKVFSLLLLWPLSLVGLFVWCGLRLARHRFRVCKTQQRGADDLQSWYETLSQTE